MKRLSKKTIIILCASAGTLLVGLSVLIAVAIFQNSQNYYELPVYYFNVTSNRLEPENRRVAVDDYETQVAAVMKMLRETPKDTALSQTWPGDEILVTELALMDTQLEIVFSSQYNEIAPLTEAIFRTSLVWTLTELPFVQQVDILVSDQDAAEASVLFGRFDCNNVDADPVISPERITTRTFKLYFVSEAADGLLAEERTTDSVNLDQIERYIVQQLIEGSKIEGRIASIPLETKIREIKTEDGICYVSLSNDFNRFNAGPVMAKLTIYSIVNSLIENVSNVKKVQFLIESERVDQFQGVPDFSRPFDKDDGLILQ